MSDEELETVLLDPGIIRNCLKVYSVRKNARVALDIQKEFGSLDQYFWEFLPSLQRGVPEGRGDFVSEKNPQSRHASSAIPLQRRSQRPIIHHGETIYDFPTESDISRALSKDLKKR